MWPLSDRGFEPCNRAVGLAYLDILPPKKSQKTFPIPWISLDNVSDIGNTKSMTSQANNNETGTKAMTIADCKMWSEFFSGATVSLKSGKTNWEVTGMMMSGSEPRALLKRTLTDRWGSTTTINASCCPSRIRLSSGSTDTQMDWRNSKWNGQRSTINM